MFSAVCAKKIPFVSSACKHTAVTVIPCVWWWGCVCARAPAFNPCLSPPHPRRCGDYPASQCIFFLFFRADRSSAASESLAKLQGQRTRGRLCSLHSPPAHSRDLPPGFLVQSERNSTTGSRGGLIVKTEQPCLIYAPSSFTETFLGGHLSTFKRR